VLVAAMLASDPVTSLIGRALQIRPADHLSAAQEIVGWQMIDTMFAGPAGLDPVIAGYDSDPSWGRLDEVSSGRPPGSACRRAWCRRVDGAQFFAGSYGVDG
jgi:hypothetical protein